MTHLTKLINYLVQENEEISFNLYVGIPASLMFGVKAVVRDACASSFNLRFQFRQVDL